MLDIKINVDYYDDYGRKISQRQFFENLKKQAEKTAQNEIDRRGKFIPRLHGKSPVKPVCICKSNINETTGSISGSI